MPTRLIWEVTGYDLDKVWQEHASWRLRQAMDQVVDGLEIFDKDMASRYWPSQVHEIAIECLAYPRLSESDWLPHIDVIYKYIEANRDYHNFLMQWIDVPSGKQESFAEADKKTDKLYEIWDWARIAKTDAYGVKYRRLAMSRVKDMIGEDEFNNCRLPAPVSLEFFFEMK